MKISQGTDRLSFIKKTSYALYIGSLLGLLSGAGRVFWFFNVDNYTRLEIQTFALNYFQSSLNQYVLFGLLAGFLFAIAWYFFDKLQGFVVSGLLVFLPVLPFAYFLNKNVFPGRMHPISLVGNGVIALFILGLTFFLFRRRFREVSFLPGFFRRRLAIAVMAFLIVINVLHAFQSEHFKLQSAPASAEKILQLMNFEGQPGFDASDSPEEILNQHFSNSLDKHLRRLPEKIVLRDSAEIIAAAERTVNHDFEFLNVRKKLPENIDWRRNLTGDREWVLAFNRMDWLWELTVAYQLTRDARYARAFDKFMLGWLKQNPVLSWKNESDNVWRLIESSARITDSWIEAFAVFFPSADVSRQVKLGMLASFHDHAQFLAHFRSPRRNHLLQETYGLLAIASAFPEFKMADAWLGIARKRLDFAMRADVYPDGGYNEGSTYYHRFAVRILQQITDFAENYDVTLSDYFYEQLERMFAFLMHTAKPDGVMSAMNDGFHAKNLRILFDEPARLFKRDDFAHFASAGLRGTVPAMASTYFPVSGIAVMRSDWSEQALHAIFDAGPFGSSHGHEDKLSFELSALGKPFVVESGTFTYVINRWRKYFTSSFAHNTIVVDGKSQMRYRLDKQWLNDPPVNLPNVWFSNEQLDYVESVYADGYGNIKEDILSGITHTRRLLFVKPYYWILWDQVQGAGQHRVEQLLHFPFETDVVVENENDVRVSYTGGPQLFIKTLSPAEGRLSVFSGEEAPVQGWVSPKYGVKHPAPVVANMLEGELPVMYLQVFFPSQNTVTLKSKLLSVTSSGNRLDAVEAIALTVETDEWRDTIMLAPHISGTKQFSDQSTDAEILLRRRTVHSDSVLVQVQTLH